MRTTDNPPATLPRDFYVYLHRKATTGEVFYVGKGTGDRAWQTSPSRRGTYWSRVAGKHGVIVEIVAGNLQEWYAHELEADLIALYGRKDIGLGPLINLTDGGEGVSGRVLSEESAARHVASVREVVSTPEWRRKHAEGVKARTASSRWKERNLVGAKKRKDSAEWREKLRQAALMRANDENYRMSLSIALKKVAADPEWRRRTAAINRKRRAKPVVCVETGRVFDAGSDALAWLQESGWPRASSSTLSRACADGKKTAYGYHWRYADQQTVSEYPNTGQQV
jgi:hypothetical protein